MPEIKVPAYGKALELSERAVERFLRLSEEERADPQLVNCFFLIFALEIEENIQALNCKNLASKEMDRAYWKKLAIKAMKEKRGVKYFG